jgi:hypothetical protein
VFGLTGVTTHLPNESAPKMDDAETNILYQTVKVMIDNDE